MAEEHRCQAQQRLCANNCGFFGCPTTQDLCSKCYRDLQLKEQQSSTAKLAFNQTLTAVAAAASSPLTSSSSISVSSSPAVIDLPEVSSYHAPAAPVVEESKKKVEEEMTVPRPNPGLAARPNRCLTCRKRVGLTGFKCRCGLVFCGTHRYPEQHGCAFDFKAMGKEQIAKANPIVKAEKLEKI
ncbi:Zinc finger A20 and AN1 domain-containing stress-associated protein 3 [Euphorbia peplus]|nr:Zinc finger A20 and AN1 domain-containing stress-associated protein 3 [Euphorbia peplus]